MTAKSEWIAKVRAVAGQSLGSAYVEGTGLLIALSAYEHGPAPEDEAGAEVLRRMRLLRDALGLVELPGLSSEMLPS